MFASSNESVFLSFHQPTQACLFASWLCRVRRTVRRGLRRIGLHMFVADVANEIVIAAFSADTLENTQANLLSDLTAPQMSSDP